MAHPNSRSCQAGSRTRLFRAFSGKPEGGVFVGNFNIPSVGR